MKQDRHGACDGCDRLKKLTLIHGRGLCINCEVLWNEAIKATEKRVLDEVKSMLKDNRCKCGYNGSLWDAFYELKQKFGVKL